MAIQANSFLRLVDAVNNEAKYKQIAVEKSFLEAFRQANEDLNLGIPESMVKKMAQKRESK